MIGVLGIVQLEIPHDLKNTVNMKYQNWVKNVELKLTDEHIKEVCTSLMNVYRNKNQICLFK